MSGSPTRTIALAECSIHNQNTQLPSRYRGFQSMTGQSKHQAWPDKQYAGQEELFEEYLATGEQMRVADDLFFRRWQALAKT